MKKLARYCKENRKKKTLAESVLFNQLMRWKIRFNTQRPFGFYIVDFIIVKKRLAIEVDGKYHNDEKQKIKDAQKSDYLKSLGFHVLHITNDEVFNDLTWLKEYIDSLPDTQETEKRKLLGFAMY